MIDVITKYNAQRGDLPTRHIVLGLRGGLILVQLGTKTILQQM